MKKSILFAVSTACICGVACTSETTSMRSTETPAPTKQNNAPEVSPTPGSANTKAITGTSASVTATPVATPIPTVLVSPTAVPLPLIEPLTGVRVEAGKSVTYQVYTGSGDPSSPVTAVTFSTEGNVLPAQTLTPAMATFQIAPPLALADKLIKGTITAVNSKKAQTVRTFPIIVTAPGKTEIQLLTESFCKNATDAFAVSACQLAGIAVPLVLPLSK